MTEKTRHALEIFGECLILISVGFQIFISSAYFSHAQSQLAMERLNVGMTPGYSDGFAGAFQLSDDCAEASTAGDEIGMLRCLVEHRGPPRLNLPRSNQKSALDEIRYMELLSNLFSGLLFATGSIVLIFSKLSRLRGH
jgi:hypothetical protein